LAAAFGGSKGHKRTTERGILEGVATALVGIPGWQEADKLVSTFTTRYFPGLRPGDINQEVFSDIMSDHLGEHARRVAIDTLRGRTCENISTVSKRIQAEADAARTTGGLCSLYIGGPYRCVHYRIESSEIAFPKGEEKRRFGNERADTDAASGLISAV